MASHATHSDLPDEPLTLPRHLRDRLWKILAVLGGAGLVLAILFCLPFLPFGGLRRFFLSYLVAFVFVLTLALGGMFFVLLHHVTRAGWSVNVRRIPEALANTMPVLAVLSLPILATFLFPGNSPHEITDPPPTLYPWAADVDDGEAHGAEAEDDHEAESQDAAAGTASDSYTAGPGGVETADEAERFGSYEEEENVLTDRALTVEQAWHHTHIDDITRDKLPWLNWPFFVLRVAIYFSVWIAIAGFYWRNSTLQDTTRDPALTTKMQKWAPLSIILFALTVTFAVFDLVMSVDPHFFSTIFGGYVFAGAAIAVHALMILVFQFLRMGGVLGQSVTREHYHDLGKWLFAWTFFWGYVAFSQYMLIWYANIPETTYWFAVRGATSVEANMGFGAWPTNPDAPANVGYWTVISMTLLFGHLLIPFAGLLSRHIKRNLTTLGFWAGWMLVMHYIDLYWLIMPEMLHGGWALLPLPEIGCLLFVVSVFGLYLVKTLTPVPLRPTGDPRLHESMAFHNI